MSKSFKPISYEKLRVGKLIKSSKKRFSWVFDLDEERYTLIMFSSRISGKRTILVNGNKILSTKTSGLGSMYQVNIPKHKVMIYELGDTNYELRVDSMLFKVPNGGGGLEVPVDQRARNLSSSDLRVNKDNFGFKEMEALEEPKKYRPSSPKAPKAPDSPAKFKISVEKPKPVQEKPKEVNVFDLFDMPLPSSTELPVDLFAAPLGANTDFNPFEEQKSAPPPQPPKIEAKVHPPNSQKDDFFNLVDLDGLHLGDNYSPAFAKKLEDANKPVTINNPNIKNVPLNNLVAQREPAQPVPGMQTMPNMANMNAMMMNQMMMNPFMTGMMMNPMMNPYYQNPPK